MLVDFPQYRGPIFIENIPTIAPLVPIETRCDCQCCTRIQMPLKLSFGRTMHTFQGVNVGPTREGQPTNAIQAVICDPGTKMFEGSKAIGLLYTLCSRCTTIGTENNLQSSALFFDGPDMTYGRIKNLFRKQNGVLFEKIRQRQLWVSYLDKHVKCIDIDQKKKNRINAWLKQPCNQIHLDCIIERMYKK